MIVFIRSRSTATFKIVEKLMKYICEKKYSQPRYDSANLFEDHVPIRS